MTIPTYKTLYKIDKNKNVSEWNIEIIPSGKMYSIITTHGIENGKKISHEHIIEEGKAKRTVLEQAILFANKKWNDKKDKELYVENAEELDNSTTKSIVVRPMLAKKFEFDLYKEVKGRTYRIEFPAYVQMKYDGIRCISHINTKTANVIMESRKGIEFTHFDALKTNLLKALQKLPPTFYFDGELYCSSLDFEVVSGLIRLKELKPGDLEYVNKIEYYIYDFVDTNRPNLKYHERLDILKNIFKKPIKGCVFATTMIANNVDEIKMYHDQFVAEGFEGAMVRDKDGIYEINKRSKYLQKYKEFMEEEFKIVGFHDGNGDEKGLVIWDCITKDGKNFAVRPKGTFEYRKKLFEEGEKYMGKKLTVIFQEYSADGVPRFGVGKAIRDIY